MTGDVWTIGRMLDWMQGYLADHGDDGPVVSSRWLVSDVTGLSFMELYTNYDRPLDSSERDKLREYVKRRVAGEPVQYIVGKTSFRHIDVMVRKGVLIPRPETEVLVSEVLRRLPSQRYGVEDVEDGGVEPMLNLADLCTGTGCVACSLAFENPLVKVIATDVSSECVSLARDNVLALGLGDRVSVVECDLGEEIPSHVGLDAVVSNPPYVPTAILSDISHEVAGYEPRLALDGGEDGLDLFRRIVDWSYDALEDDGFLAVELHETTLDEAATYAREAGFAEVAKIDDLAGKPRVLVASKYSEPDSR